MSQVMSPLHNKPMKLLTKHSYSKLVSHSQNAFFFVLESGKKSLASYTRLMVHPSKYRDKS